MLILSSRVFYSYWAARGLTNLNILFILTVWLVIQNLSRNSTVENGRLKNVSSGRYKDWVTLKCANIGVWFFLATRFLKFSFSMVELLFNFEIDARLKLLLIVRFKCNNFHLCLICHYTFQIANFHVHYIHWLIVFYVHLHYCVYISNKMMYNFSFTFK